MRIEFKSMPGPFRSYYVFADVKERIRFDGGFYWNFDGRIYRTCASNYPKIYFNDEKIASCSTKYGQRGIFWWHSWNEWKVVDIDGRNWRFIETRRNGGWQADWKTPDGKRIMVFCRKSCPKGTAVIRSDWSKNVGLLVGMVVPLILSTG